jgi:hypothetical protein
MVELDFGRCSCHRQECGFRPRRPLPRGLRKPRRYTRDVFRQDETEWRRGMISLKSSASIPVVSVEQALAVDDGKPTGTT